jgi:hypothetical protein
MPKFEVTAPDGRTFEVDGPPGSTKEQAIEYIRSQVEQGAQQSQQPQGQSLADTLASIDSMPVAQQNYDPEGSTTSYLGQQVKKGVAAAAGLPVDAITNALNLGIAGYGTIKGALGGTDLPQLIQDPVGGSKSLERFFLTNNNIKPTSPEAEVAGRFVRDMSGAAIPAAGIAAKAANPIASLAVQAGLTGLASTGGQVARTMAPEPYKDVADISGMLLAGVAVPAAIANRMEAVNALRDVAKPNNVNRLADRYVSDQITNDVRHWPGAAQNLDDAARIEQEIPGLKLRVGQASGVPSLLDMERRVAVAGPEQFNRRVLQDIEQQALIKAEAEKRLPLLAGKHDVSQRLTETQSQRQALAAALPESQADDIGRILRDTRSSMKGRYDQIASQKFSAPVEEAEKLNVRINPQGLVARTQEILGNPILEFDATNAPAVSRRILEASSQMEVKYTGPRLLDANGREMVVPRERPTQITFDQLKAMREAVNQDIAREAGSTSPNARQRLRALVEVRSEIDKTAQQAPESVRKLWNDATTWYRDVYAPKFLRGVNLKQSMKDMTGELRIADEKLASQYFKPLGDTPMKRFMDLYGDNPQAMRAMESHVLDTYRKYTVRDGVIDPKRHEAFMRNYGAPLKKLPELAENFKSLSTASSVLARREEQLIQAQKVLSQGQLDALKFEALPDAGIDPRKVNAFLTKNGASFAESISSLYGKKVADEHLKNLRDIAKAAEMADRGRLSDQAAPKQSTSPLSLQGGFGFSGRTVFSMIRAVTTGRTSGEDVAYTLGAQSASHRISKALIAAEERAISDPETAKLIAQAMKQPATSKEGMFTLKNILTKGGMYLVGGNKFAEYGKYRAAPFAIDANQGGLQSPAQQNSQPRQGSLSRIDGRMVPNPSAPTIKRTPSSGVRG